MRTTAIGPCKAVVLCAALLVGVSGLAWAESGSDGQETVVAGYTITRGAPKLDAPVSGAAERSKADAVITYLYAAIPVDVKTMVTRLELFTTPQELETAADGTASQNDDGATWTLSVDYTEGESGVVEKDAANGPEFDETIVHEIGHVPSLNEKQMTDDDSLGTYSDEAGSYRADSYINQFWQRFWKTRFPEAAPGDDASSRYAANPNAFVTDYAATDASEDFAESFAYFVLNPKPSGTTDKARKLQFFYAYPELVKDRDFMRAHLATEK